MSFPLLGDPYDSSFIGLGAGCIWLIVGWLLSTRVKLYQSMKMRVVQFFVMCGGILFLLLRKITANMAIYVISYFQDRADNIDLKQQMVKEIIISNTKPFLTLLMAMPSVAFFMLILFLYGKFNTERDSLLSAFKEYKWNGKWLQKFSKWEQTEKWPDIELGKNAETGEMVIIPGEDRQLGTQIIGSVGTGKTAALGKPIINQDLHHMTDYINDYPVISKMKNFHSKEVKGRYLTGLSIIEPSNDLCQDVYRLVKAHGIPEESITYINPLDKNTPSINAMKGPVDKVAEVFAQVIQGLNDSKDGGNFFFEQSQRNHLKHYIYLLKLHNLEKEVTLDMLLRMYNNALS
jgi:hypothetical protein